MTSEQGTPEAVVKIRAPARRAWNLFLVIGGSYLAIAALSLMGGWPRLLPNSIRVGATDSWR
jgi:hypothetical protein